MKNRGFTLIELLVVIGIVTVITGVVLANYGEFGSRILLRNLTYDLALTIREAQVFGISGRFQEGDAFAGSTPIIIYFDRTPSIEYLFYMFKDKNGNLEQDIGEFIAGYNLGQGFIIFDIEANNGAITGIVRLAIRFQRPEPDADIFGSTSGSGPLILYENVRIVIQSPSGEKLSVFIESAGQISVQRVAP